MAIIELVNYQLGVRIRNDENTSYFKLESGVARKTKFEERRSPEEFQAYLKDLFDKPGPVVKYNWIQASRRKRSSNIVEQAINDMS